ncbi:MAG: ComEA family DNA-binding protein [Gammaproteobacteria bacterium]|nr:ComEA family DNA-binding protein [Gammaproteobacteria bacterium]
MKALRHLVLAALLATGIGPLAAAPVDINTADAATLAAGINGVGPSRAAAIIAYREANGPFTSVDELTVIRGIGPKLLERNREVLSVGDAAEGARGAAQPQQ